MDSDKFKNVILKQLIIKTSWKIMNANLLREYTKEIKLLSNSKIIYPFARSHQEFLKFSEYISNTQHYLPQTSYQSMKQFILLS